MVIFLSIVAHDLRGPIHLIKMNADLLKKDIKNKKSIEKIELRVNNIRRISENMGRLVDILLDINDDATCIPIEKDKIKILSVLRRAVDNYSLLSVKNGIAINLYAIGAVDCLVECDGYKIEQVMGNLLDNAIKYAPKSSEISVIIEKVDGGVCVSVSNRGCHLTPEDCKLIFDKNFVFDARACGARGLGLFISKMIIDGHDGKIWAEVNRELFKISFILR